MTAIELSSFRGARLPTPTAKGNHLAPYMQRWSAYARLQRACGTGGYLPARMAAWLMGLTDAWLSASGRALTSEPVPAQPVSSGRS
jgi:hypothetical protein